MRRGKKTAQRGSTEPMLGTLPPAEVARKRAQLQEARAELGALDPGRNRAVVEYLLLEITQLRRELRPYGLQERGRDDGAQEEGKVGRAGSL